MITLSNFHSIEIVFGCWFIIFYPFGCFSSSLRTVLSQNSKTRWSFRFRRKTSIRLTRFGCFKFCNKCVKIRGQFQKHAYVQLLLIANVLALYHYFTISLYLVCSHVMFWTTFKMLQPSASGFLWVRFFW